MNTTEQILIGFITIIHLYIVFFEMFAWESRGKKVFKNFPEDLFKQTKALAANMGLYNGFLAAGLTWSLLIENKVWSINIAFFFLVCVAIAGIFGALTAEKKIFFSQALPAIVAILLILS